MHTRLGTQSVQPATESADARQYYKIAAVGTNQWVEAAKMTTRTQKPVSTNAVAKNETQTVQIRNGTCALADVECPNKYQQKT